MKKLIALTAVCLACSGSAMALLPPLYQGIAELKAILNNDMLEQMLDSGEVITSITKTDEGYTIQTNHQQLLAQVVYEPNKLPGPAKFKILFKKP